jgi:hypothetical protein
MIDLDQLDSVPAIAAAPASAPELDPVAEFRLKVDTNSPQPVNAAQLAPQRIRLGTPG